MAKGSIGERVYRRLLRLYPRDFSDDYADEMTRLYRDRVRGDGPASVCFALLADVARTVPREQISTLGQDVRHAWRTWRRTPVLALAGVSAVAMTLVGTRMLLTHSLRHGYLIWNLFLAWMPLFFCLAAVRLTRANPQLPRWKFWVLATA